MAVPAQHTHVRDDVTRLPEPCASCGAAVDTPYCPACGEQRASDRHYTLLHFGEEVFETFTHADGRLARTLQLLVARPGALTAHYMAGRRRPYIGPLQLFLIVNVIFFLAGATRFGIHAFDTPLAVQLDSQPYSAVVQRLVGARLAARHLSLAAYAERFDHAATAEARSLLILLVPMFGALTALVTLPARRFAVQHVVFALHVLSLMMLLLLAEWVTILGISFAARAAGDHFVMSDATFSSLLAVVWGAYLARALMTAYRESRGPAVARAVLLTLLVLPMLAVYRFLLFYVAFYTT